MPNYYFIGFSTTDSLTTKQTTFYDVELVKRDLMNHFMTRVGERVMRPTWGCMIWDWLMEPYTEVLRDQIIAEATRICEADTRCEVMAVNPVETDKGITVQITLNFVPQNVISTFAVDFETRTAATWNAGPSTGN